MNRKEKKMGPENPFCDSIGAEKYRGPNEDHRELSNRVAGALTDDQDHYKAFRDSIGHQRFSPPGRVLAGAGSIKNVTLYNCFVMPTIHDSFVDGPTEEERLMLGSGEFAPESIMDVAKLAATTMRQGGGVGYDFSSLRPAGDMIHGVQSTTDGPLAFAGIFDRVCKATASAGNRRGAQMAVMRIDHPDVESFIRAKQVEDQSIPWDMRPLRGFNMSLAVTDEFMEAKASGKPFALKFQGKKYREVDAEALWNMVMRGTYDWAEPGVLFIDRINQWNNLWYCERIAATNPCGEQPLPPYGACLLGSFNLVKYLIPDGNGGWTFDYDLLEHDIYVVVRAMDNVIDRSRYPLPQQRMEAQNKRRMGLGVTGLANALEAQGMPYGTDGFLMLQDEVMSFITNHCYMASALLAKEKGSFPLYNEAKYMQGKFIKTLWPETQEAIRTNGIRNSHLTSIAPTGTISLYADNVSSGVEPVFSHSINRTAIMKDGPRSFVVNDYAVEKFGIKGRTAMGDITAKEHINVLVTAQKNVDSAVSKTVNVPSDYPFADFKGLYDYAYENGAKGCTTYRPAGQYDEPLKEAVDTTSNSAGIVEDGTCGFDPVTGQRTGACAE